MAESVDPDDRTHTETAFAGSRRRRSFVATTAADWPPLLPPRGAAPTLEAEVEDSDLPLLTEIVPIEDVAPAMQAERQEEAGLSSVAADLVHALEQRLTSELPALIETSLLNARNELRTGISMTLNAALHDFLAQRQQLNLPLEEPDQDAAGS